MISTGPHNLMSNRIFLFHWKTYRYFFKGRSGEAQSKPSNNGLGQELVLKPNFTSGQSETITLLDVHVVWNLIFDIRGWIWRTELNSKTQTISDISIHILNLTVTLNSFQLTNLVFFFLVDLDTTIVNTDIAA